MRSRRSSARSRESDTKRAPPLPPAPPTTQQHMMISETHFLFACSFGSHSSLFSWCVNDYDGGGMSSSHLKTPTAGYFSK